MVDLRDFRTLKWPADEGPWSSAATARFVAGDWTAGRPGHLRLDGLDQCSNLTELIVLDHRVASLSPLQALTELEHVTLSGPRRLPADNDLDLEHLTQATNLHRLVLLAAGRIRSLAPLLHLTRMRDVGIDEVAIDDGDLTPLSQLPRWTRVTPPSTLLD